MVIEDKSRFGSRDAGRYCGRCRGPLALAPRTMMGVRCPICGAIAPSRPVVGGSAVRIRRPTELAAIRIALNSDGPTQGMPRTSASTRSAAIALSMLRSAHRGARATQREVARLSRRFALLPTQVRVTIAAVVIVVPAVRVAIMLLS